MCSLFRSQSVWIGFWPLTPDDDWKLSPMGTFLGKIIPDDDDDDAEENDDVDAPVMILLLPVLDFGL